MKKMCGVFFSILFSPVVFSQVHSSTIYSSGIKGKNFIVTYEEKDGYAIYQGDIILGKMNSINHNGICVKENVLSSCDSAISSALSNHIRWDNGIVPYKISSSFNSSDASKIQSAMQAITDRTNYRIRFIQRTNQKDYIGIKKLSGCYSYVGRVGGSQTLSLGSGCVNPHTIKHELLHALGFWHEQSRPDRNSYIKINYENISPGKDYNFAINSINKSISGAYDYKSIMHYSLYAFSKNGKRTIEPIKDPGISDNDIGRLRNLSEGDVKALNLAYPI